MTNPMLAPTYGFDQGFETYQFYEVQDLSNPVMDAAYNWLDALPAGQPFFAYLHFMDVHGPYDAPREDFDALRDSPSLGSPYHLTEEEVDGISGYLKRIPWAQTEEARELLNWRAHYAAGIRDFDRRFSSFIERLRTSGRLDQTYLVLTSDHGDELFEHRGWDHGHSLFDHQLHVPLFIRRPHGEGARVVENVVSIIDIMPTLLSIAGIEPPASLQGRNLSRLFAASLTEPPPDNDDDDDHEVSHGTATSDRPGLHAVRTRRHKLIFDLDTGETRLFDVKSDPGEQENLADQRTEMVRRLRDQLLTQVAESTAQGALEKRTAPVPDELVEQLRTLGYVQ
jgi:arylsulfatase A-like enzyme